MLKKTKFNNGDHINFEIIKANRKQAVREISEGNKGLEQLLNTCIDLNIETFASCGDYDSYISLVYNEHTKKYLVNLIRVLSRLENQSRKYYDIVIMNSFNNKIVFSIYINAKDIDTSYFFLFIDNLIHEFSKVTFNPKTDNLIIMDLMVKLKNIFSDGEIIINFSKRFSNEYPYIVVINGINQDNQEIARDILTLNGQTLIYGKTSYTIYCQSFQQIVQIYNCLNEKKHSRISK